MKPANDTSNLKATIQRNFNELNNAILKLTALEELRKLELTYCRMSFFVIAEHALYNDLLAHAIKVLDEHRDAMSFWYVLRCEERVVNKALSAAGLDLNQLKALSVKLMHVRDKTLFHIDRKSVKEPASVWLQADIEGSDFAEALPAIASTLAYTKKQLFGGELEVLTKYDGSDIRKIVNAFESEHGLVHGA
jgi:hypothetical protein